MFDSSFSSWLLHKLPIGFRHVAFARSKRSASAGRPMIDAARCHNAADIGGSILALQGVQVARAETSKWQHQEGEENPPMSTTCSPARAGSNWTGPGSPPNTPGFRPMRA